MPIYQLNKFFGGMTADEKSGPAGSLYDAQNVDLSNINKVILSRNRFDNISYNIGSLGTYGPPINILNGSSVSYRLTFTKNGYAQNFLGTIIDLRSIVNSYIANAGVIYGTLSGGGVVPFGFILGNNGKVYKWRFEENDLNLGMGANGENISLACTLPNDTNGGTSFFRNKSPYIINNFNIYVSGGNNFGHNVYAIDASGETWLPSPTYLKLDRGYTVKYMSNIGDYKIIYASDGKNSRQYFWGGDTTVSYERYIDWYDKPIQGGLTINNEDYVVVGTDSTGSILIPVLGYQPGQAITKTDIRPQNNQYERFKYVNPDDVTNIYETIQDTIVLPGSSWIYKYGNNKPGMPRIITRDELYGSVYCMNYNSIDGRLILGIGTSFSGSLTASLVETDLRAPTQNSSTYSPVFVGKVYGLKFDNSSYSQIKEAVKIRVGYKLPKRYSGTNITQATSINIYARTEKTRKYANFYCYTQNNAPYTNAPAIGDVYSMGGVNWEVVDITKRVRNGNQEEKQNGFILHCYTEDLYFDGDLRQVMSGELTKQSGVGDAIFSFNTSDFGYKLLQKISGYDVKNDGSTTFMLKDKLDDLRFQEIQLKADLMTDDSCITPELYEMILLFNVVQDELK